MICNICFFVYKCCPLWIVQIFDSKRGDHQNETYGLFSFDLYITFFQKSHQHSKLISTVFIMRNDYVFKSNLQSNQYSVGNKSELLANILVYHLFSGTLEGYWLGWW